MHGSVIIDADMHLRDPEEELRAFLPERWNRRKRLFPGDHFDRNLNGRLGKRQVDARTQLDDMAAEGIDLAILYPTNGLHMGEIRERDYAVALAQAYNRWVVEYCRADPERLKAVALLPVQDPEAAAEELVRARHAGLVGAMLPVHAAVGPRYSGDPWLDPIFAAAERAAMPLAYHATGGLTPANQGFPTFLQLHVYSHVPDQIAALTGVVLGGVLERFPRLRIGFLEAGCGWLPFWLEHMDEEWALRREEAPELTLPPSAYVRSGRCFFGIEPEESLIPLVADRVGSGALMYASDYPHWDSGWPNTTRELRERDDLSEELKQKLLSGNARRFYGLDTDCETRGEMSSS